MIEMVYWVGSGKESGILEKISNVVDSVLHDLQLTVDLMRP